MVELNGIKCNVRRKFEIFKRENLTLLRNLRINYTEFCKIRG